MHSLLVSFVSGPMHMPCRPSLAPACRPQIQLLLLPTTQCSAGEIPEDNDFRFVDWFPEPVGADDGRFPCCGYHCQLCPGGLGENGDPYFCANNSPVRTLLRLYNLLSCLLVVTVGHCVACAQVFSA